MNPLLTYTKCSVHIMHMYLAHIFTRTCCYLTLVAGDKRKSILLLVYFFIIFFFRFYLSMLFHRWLFWITVLGLISYLPHLSTIVYTCSFQLPEFFPQKKSRRFVLNNYQKQDNAMAIDKETWVILNKVVNTISCYAAVLHMH